MDWGEVYRTTYEDLVRFLHRKVWDVERARDLAQEAFVRALRYEPDRPKAWLFRVAGNLAKDEARTVLRRKRHLTLLRSEVEDEQRVSPPKKCSWKKNGGFSCGERWTNSTNGTEKSSCFGIQV